MASGGALKPNKSEEYHMKLKESLVSQFCLGNWLRQRREIIAVSETTMCITNGQRDALDPKKMRLNPALPPGSCLPCGEHGTGYSGGG
ncbi:hypothetical protein TKK_0016824 [Trichogramma kaykai]